MDDCRDLMSIFLDAERRLDKGEFSLTNSIIDCHVHTNYSDAICYAIEDFRHDLISSNIKIYSLTEHDNFASSLAARDLVDGTTPITGIELSTDYTPLMNMHIKGFFPELPGRHTALVNYCKEIAYKREERMVKVLSIFNELFHDNKVPAFEGRGYLKITIDDLSCLLGNCVYDGAERIPQFYNTFIISSYIEKYMLKLMVSNYRRYEHVHDGLLRILYQETSRRIHSNEPYNDEEFLKYFGKGMKIEEDGISYDDNVDWNGLIEHFLLLPTKSGYTPLCYVKKPHPLSPDEAIKIIHGAGGIAELAHPCETYGDDMTLLMKDVENHCFDGIEVYSPKNDSHLIPLLKLIAESKNLYCGFGSDTHGFITRGKRDLGNLIMRK